MNLDNYGNTSAYNKYTMHHKRSSKLNFEGEAAQQQMDLKNKIINIKASVNVMSSNERRELSSDFLHQDKSAAQKPKDDVIDIQKDKYFQEIQNVNQGFQIQ